MSVCFILMNFDVYYWEFLLKGLVTSFWSIFVKLGRLIFCHHGIHLIKSCSCHKNLECTPVSCKNIGIGIFLIEFSSSSKTCKLLEVSTQQELA
jgi:hypothetical protein